MKLYLVRHGVTQDNIDGVHQTDETAINKKGQKQAQLVAKKLANIKIDKMYVSPLDRTYQTAEIISKSLNVPILINENLKEIKKPTEIIGKAHKNIEAFRINEKIRKNYHNLSWHYSDEENFRDIKKRCASFLKSIEKKSKEDEGILLITHNYIAKALVSLAIFRNELTSRIFLDFYDNTVFSNTGIIEMEYKPTTGFKLISWDVTVC